MIASGLRLDLHNHTAFSSDGAMTPAELLDEAKAKGLGCIAVTDHNTVEGAMQTVALSEADPGLPRVIPGIEVASAAGDIIGLYVREAVPPGLPLDETIALIRRQGGVVYLPHPYDVVRRGTVSGRERARAADQADLVEVLNGRSLSPVAVRRSMGLARRRDKPGGAGSDAHFRAEVGRAYVIVARQPSRDDLVALVAEGVTARGLLWHEYPLNWALQGMAPVTRARRRLARVLSRG